MMENISLREAQQRVDKWILTTGKGYFSELTNMAVLTEEVGELARIISRAFGDQVAKEGDIRKGVSESLSEELADILWVVLCLANQTGVDMTAAFEAAVEKRIRRDSHRFD